MKTFVVNLEKNKERLLTISRRLDALGIDFERINAIYGREVHQREKLRNSSAFWWWAIKGYPMRDGEYGCAMSHLLIYKRMIEDGTPYACILEDDAIPRSVLPRLLTYLEKNIDSNRAQVYLISNHRGDKGVEGGFNSVRVEDGSCTDGYVITVKAAKKILEKNFPIRCPSDTWGLWAKKRWIELYQAYPEGVNQEWRNEGYTSDVTTSGDIVVRFSDLSFTKKIFWKTSRIIGWFFTCIMK